MVQGSTQALVCHIFEGESKLVIRAFCHGDEFQMCSLFSTLVELFCSLFSTLLELFFFQEINFLAHNLTRWATFYNWDGPFMISSFPFWIIVPKGGFLAQ